MVKLEEDFYKKLIQVSSNTGMNPEDILNVMAVESGLNPSAHNKNGNASGLVQFMPSTLKNLGFKGSHEEFRTLEAHQQLIYVEKLIKSMMRINGGPLTSAVQYYIGNFVPAALKIPGIKNKDASTIIVSQNPDQPHIPGVSLEKEKLFYNYNKGLDYDKDGNITYKDIQNVLARAANGKNFKSAIEELRKHTDNESLTKNDNDSDPFIKYIKRYKDKSVPMIQTKNLLPTTNNTVQNDNMNTVLDKYLRMIAASETSNRILYKTVLPKHNILIKVEGKDFTTSIEFCRILTSVLETELTCQAYTHTDNEHVEVECQIHGPSQDCLNVVNTLSHITASTFIETIKTNDRISLECIYNKTSNYRPLKAVRAQQEYRKFLLKLIG